jgi:dTDP-4-amino-4,6-dideoxygalactose transaminase
MSDWKIQLAQLDYDGRETQAAAAVVDSAWLTMGARTAEFEAQFAEFLGGGCTALAVSSCTAALHMSLLALGVGPGDDVVIPALTFVAAANVVRMVGATPVVADCASLDDWNVSAKTLSRAITPATRAVIIVHFAGYPCQMAEITELCQARGIPLIEDTAHAPGAMIAGESCGTFGDIGCFSFFSNKNLATGEGGMAVARDPDLVQRLRHLRSHGMTTLTMDRHKGRATSYDVAAPGLNYRIDEVRSAIGLVQLDKLPAGNQQRRELTDAYRRALADVDVAMPFSGLPNDTVSACHILPVLLPEGTDRQAAMAHLKRQGIQSSIHYPAFSEFTAYQDRIRPDDATIATEISARELTLPLYPAMSVDDVATVCTALANAITETTG